MLLVSIPEEGFPSQEFRQAEEELVLGDTVAPAQFRGSFDELVDVLAVKVAIPLPYLLDGRR